jgi:hypothetical protein
MQDDINYKQAPWPVVKSAHVYAAAGRRKFLNENEIPSRGLLMKTQSTRQRCLNWHMLITI